MVFSLLILGLLLSVVALRLTTQITLYKRVQHYLSSILQIRNSINKAIEILPAYYIEELISNNSWLAQDTDDLISYLKKSNLIIFFSKSKAERFIEQLVNLVDRYSCLEAKLQKLSVGYQRLKDWTFPNTLIPSGTSKLAWMYGECSWFYFKSCPNILSEIEYTTNQLTKYVQSNDIGRAIVLLHKLDELQEFRDLSIKRTDAARKEVESLSKTYLDKVNLLADLRSSLDCLDLSHLIATDPNIAGSINELYSLMRVGVQDDWTKSYYRGNYDWVDEMLKAEVLIDKAIFMYKDLEKRCKETKEASLDT